MDAAEAAVVSEKPFVIRNLPWMLIYGVGFIAIVFLLTGVQSSVLAAYDAEDEAAWQEWKRDSANKDGRLGPVARREATSDEPPMLLLLRDHFPAVAISILVFYTCMFGFAMFVGKGLARGRRKDMEAQSPTL